MVKRYFYKAQRDRRYYSHHYQDETYEGVFEAKVENFISNLLKRIFRRNA